MKKLLFQLDTDTHPAVFDTVVGYDGGADHVIGHGNCHEDNIQGLVEGTIFTRAPKNKKNTAIFVGGSDMMAGAHLFNAVQKHFFADFRVSVMLDSNGSNTTAAAAVATMLSHYSISGKKAVILAGTGPVGQRAAYMLHHAGAQVSLTSRSMKKAKHVCKDIKQRFDIDVEPLLGDSYEARAGALKGAQIVLAAGAAGAELIKEEQWKDIPSIEVMADANATPPLGIGGTEMMDKGKDRNGKIIWGAISFGTLKLAVHRACIEKLFESNDKIFDSEEIFALAKEMA